jgi:uncharacterized protein YbjT (DUF2867 family)
VTKPILVTGGTGTLGRHLVRELLDRDRPVRVLSRRSRPGTDREPYEWATGNLRDGTGIDAAVSEVDTIVHCASSSRGDAEATRRLAETARRAGRPHLVYISIVGVDRIPFFYYRAKFEAERALESSGLPWTVLRATQFHDLIASMSAAQRRLPVTFTLSGARFQPVEVTEVATRLAGLAVGEPAGRVPDMGGPEVRDARELAETYLRATGRRRPVIPVPLPGKAMRALRAGENLTPEHADGKITFDEYLRERP